MLCIIGNSEFFGCQLLDGFETSIFLRTVQKAGIQLSDDMLSFFLVGVQIGRIGPSNQEVVGKGLPCYLFTEFLK